MPQKKGDRIVSETQPDTAPARMQCGHATTLTFANGYADPTNYVKGWWLDDCIFLDADRGQAVEKARQQDCGLCLQGLTKEDVA